MIGDLMTLFCLIVRVKIVLTLFAKLNFCPNQIVLCYTNAFRNINNFDHVYDTPGENTLFFLP